MKNKSNILILFPNQLFHDHPAVEEASHVILIEDPRFFMDFNYCKAKLILHRASMQAYKAYLESHSKVVKYVDYRNASLPGYIEKFLADKKDYRITMFEPEDFTLERLIDNIADKQGFEIDILENPLFLTDKHSLIEHFADKKKYLMNSFYIHQRKKFNILVEDGKPVGGKWSFDKENRKSFKKEIKLPKPDVIYNEYISDARTYVKYFFSDAPGEDTDFIFPIIAKGAKEQLDNFFKHCFKYFGDYEDAIVADEPYLFHSLMSSSLNIGLISPKEVIDRAIEYAEKNDVPLNCVEGFVRQVIGWREYVRAMHAFNGEYMREKNFWKFKKKMPAAFYDGTTGIDPVDIVIKRVLKHGYAHHIERLMVLGSFMLLCEIHADYVYKWFMELFVDAYDWVMVPNVYGMSQYAAGDVMTTKPYICSSNYILKMSDFKKGDWCDVWDALYWRFIDKHRKVFEDNARMKVMTYHLNKMDKARLDGYNKTAEKFLKGLK